MNGHTRPRCDRDRVRRIPLRCRLAPDNCDDRNRSRRAKSIGFLGHEHGSHNRSSVYRALAEHDKAAAYPEAVEQARAEFAHRAGDDIPPPVRAHIACPDEVPTPDEPDLRQRLIALRAEPSTTEDRPLP